MFGSFSISQSPPLSNKVASNPTRRACDTCRRLKIKCRTFLSGSSSSAQRDPRPCNSCRREKLKCTYLDRPATRGRPLKRVSQASSAKLEKLLDLNALPLRENNSQHSEHSVGGESESALLRKTLISNRDGEESSFVPSVFDDFDIQSTESPSEGETVFSNINDQLHPGLSSNHRIYYPNDIYSPKVCMLRPPVPQDNENIWSTINEYFDSTYVIYPIVSYVDVMTRLMVDADWESVPDLRTLLLSMRLLNASAKYRMDLQNMDHLSDIIRQVEASRLGHDFADPATYDAVFCSLCLFTAYNVLEKHNRAFLYLDEALVLFDAVVPGTDDENHRRLRIELVLFNTESATHAAYATKSRKCKARKPLLDSASNRMVHHGFGINAECDKVATHLLKRLTQIHLASDVDELEQAGVESDVDMAALFGAVVEQHRYSRIQAADVIITRQWQLSAKLVARRRRRSSLEKLLQSSVDSLGVAAMSWICLLREGELRIVGLAKLAGLALNICALADLTSCQDILRGLTGALMREDHDRKFALPLANLFTSMTCSISPQIGLRNDRQLWHTSMNALASTQSDPTPFEHLSDIGVWEVELEEEPQSYEQWVDAEQVEGFHSGYTNWLVPSD